WPRRRPSWTGCETGSGQVSTTRPTEGGSAPPGCPGGALHDLRRQLVASFLVLRLVLPNRRMRSALGRLSFTVPGHGGMRAGAWPERSHEAPPTGRTLCGASRPEEDSSTPRPQRGQRVGEVRGEMA